MNKPPKDNKDKKNEERDEDDIISPLQGVMTGNLINLDGNPFTPF